MPENPSAFPLKRDPEQKQIGAATLSADGFVGIKYEDRDQLGMTLRDYFAAQCQEDDRLVKCIRAMDDSALEIFALHPTCEREEHITDIDLTNWSALPSEVAKVARRLELEARAIARVRYIQADALLAERERSK